MWFLKPYDVVFRIISFVKNVKTELDFKLILSCASASYADSFFSFSRLMRFLFSLLIQIPYFPLHFGQISSIMDIGFLRQSVELQNNPAMTLKIMCWENWSMNNEKKLNLPQSLILLLLIIISVAVCIRLKTGGPMIGLFASWIFIYLFCKAVRIPYDHVVSGAYESTAW